MVCPLVQGTFVAPTHTTGLSEVGRRRAGCLGLQMRSRNHHTGTDHADMGSGHPAAGHADMGSGHPADPARLAGPPGRADTHLLAAGTHPLRPHGSPGDAVISAQAFTMGMPPPGRRLGIERLVRQRHRESIRMIGRDLLRIRTDAGASQREVSILGADLSIRVSPGTGPRLTDRHQARMAEALIRSLNPVWRPHLEVPVWRPARGVIDIVLERSEPHLLVATKVHSELRRLEQQLRWSSEKAGSLTSSNLVGNGIEPSVSTLLVLRSTSSTRDVARRFEATLRTAYPAATSRVLGALRDGEPWPGPGIAWIRIEGERVELLDAPPRGVSLGR